MVKCNRCILDSDIIPELKINNNGECNFCEIHNRLGSIYPTGEKGNAILQDIIKKMKKRGRGKRYDCIVGISGGCDSSYLLTKTVEWGLRPLAVHWNNGWNTDIAKNNINKMIDYMKCDYIEVNIKRDEYDDLCGAFLLASVCDADIPNDIALTEVLYEIALSFNVKYILDAHNFRTEGTAPLSWSYMDGMYIKTIHDKFGSVKMNRFPNLWLKNLIYYSLMGFKRPRLLYYVDYIKEDAKKYLHDLFEWEWYGGHHMENKYTIFIGNYIHPLKFGIDLRWIEYSALIRSGQMTKNEALIKLKEKPYMDEKIIEEVKERLHLSYYGLDEIMFQPKKTHNDYKTYRNDFRRLKLLFWLMNKFKRIPDTFYIKYVRGV